MKIITRAIWILSLVSLLTDVSSEMLYPVMPIYLKHIGFSVLLIGLLEGLAEAVAGFSKGYFGKLSDHIGSRVPFIRLGYFLSALSKPMMAAFTYPGWIFSARTMDRLGKGLRTGARDAQLSDQTTPEHKGKVFGFHRSMDTIGAVIGPLVALIYLYYYPGQYRIMFVLAFSPGLLGVAITFLLREKKKRPIEDKKPNLFSFLKYWKESPAAYRSLVSGLLCFALINSSDVFLLLLLKAKGISDVHLIMVYVFYNLCYAAFAYPAGIIADRIGLKTTLIIGLLFFATVYGGIAFVNTLPLFLLLFALYGLYAAMTEGISKALISNVSKRSDIATAIGTYAAFSSIMALLSSSIAGLVWFSFGPMTLFVCSATGAFLVILYFVIIKLTPGSIIDAG
ncbi:MFS transporter [Mucilaginibacter flavidus]|uniref:MFS transporter n=1 Tax=Mucilaginibacter flavidus TaxID=2949309 RepID=UPI002093519A|nr:MFS transporter [Mucilaginibacter flavidus]MCO5950863.1 MFS transporter [Mucilaginibacter flavidus]